jgi:hypothetical protein
MQAAVARTRTIARPKRDVSPAPLSFTRNWNIGPRWSPTRPALRLSIHPR